MIVEDRKAEEFEDDRKKWKIYFDLEPNTPGGESVVTVRFRRSENKSPYLSEENLKKLKQDLRNLGKLRIIKQGKEFLKNET